jgi:hypothetical protein
MTCRKKKNLKTKLKRKTQNIFFNRTKIENAKDIFNCTKIENAKIFLTVRKIDTAEP